MPTIRIDYEKTFISEEVRKKTKISLREKILNVPELELDKTKPELITIHFFKAEPTGEEQVAVYVTMDKRAERQKTVQNRVAEIVRAEILEVQKRLFGESYLTEVFCPPFDHKKSGFAG
jgi:hypothetical protein